MLAVDQIGIAKTLGGNRAVLLVTVHGSDLPPGTVRFALQDQRSGEYLTLSGWRGQLSWLNPISIDGGGDRLELRFDDMLAVNVTEHAPYLARLRFAIQGDEITFDAPVNWALSQSSRSTGRSRARRIALRAAGLVVVLAASFSLWIWLSGDDGTERSPAPGAESGRNPVPSASLPPERRDPSAQQPAQSLDSLATLREAAEAGDGAAALSIAVYYDPTRSESVPGLGKNAKFAYRWYREAEKNKQPAVQGYILRLSDWVEARVDEGDADLAPLLMLMRK